MNTPKINEAIPLIGTLFGGITIGVIARNSFVDWTGETLLAGLLGLGGGWLAYRAATYQQRAIEESNSLAFKSKYRSAIQDIDATLSIITSQGVDRLDRSIASFFGAEDKLTEMLSQPHVVDSELTEMLSACTTALLNASDIRKDYVGNPEHTPDGDGYYYPIEHPGIVFPFIQNLETKVRRLRNYCGGDSVFL